MYVLIGLFVFAFGYVLTPCVIALSWRIRAVDIPEDARRMHREVIPRDGGIAIFFSFLLGALLTGSRSPFSLCLLIGGGAMLFMGLLDDIYCLGAGSKLLFQFAVSAAAVFFSGAVDAGLVAPAVLWVVLLINAHNFVDGMDGLLVGCTAIEGGALSVSLALSGQTETALFALFLTLSALSFRPYNRYPARVFAGDCGSESIGFLLGMLSLPLFSFSQSSFSTLTPLFLFAYPLTEVFTSVLRRILRGRSPFSADRAHLHHRLYAKGLSQPECTGALLTVCTAFCILGCLLCMEELQIVAAIACLFGICVLLGVRKYVLRMGDP
ncbi:MAG: undecaprenyl/decaprenyl-phosphate alpha-N-acetylglucosaminyl 1-phosphate transferase [Clostridia bacterium]|nr:undecaprenyl/decaprenyl-phosphate alpha-N-acetylglucosaminyl 1-phosphate transferase [Clostridia bacterium]